MLRRAIPRSGAGGSRRSRLQPAGGALPPSARPPGLLPSTPPPAASRDAATEPEERGLCPAKVVAGGRRRPRPQRRSGGRVGEARGSRCCPCPPRSAPGPLPPSATPVSLGVCMRSLAWADRGGHVARPPEAARQAGTSAALTARRPAVPRIPRRGPRGPAGNSGLPRRPGPERR